MNLSVHRFVAVLQKELIQARRDRFTLALMIGMPLVQLFLFGFAINTDPKHLPTALVMGDDSRPARSLVESMRATEYFDISQPTSPAEAERAMARGDVLFVLEVPVDFARLMERQERPAVLLAADATDPTAVSSAFAAASGVGQGLLARDLPGAAPPARPFDWRVHRRYNPEGITAYNIVPGLIGTLLTFTLVVITALAVTRERERGTMENLLAMPVRPLEVMLGKIVPYIFLGYVQVALILGAAVLVFQVPLRGSVLLLLVGLGLFIAANLAVGFTFSTLARNQLQAMQMAVFFILPSILLSGFMFPFAGMPGWARVLGEMLPLTHALRLIRGILLKGNGALDVLPHLLPLMLFSVVVGTLAIRGYRQTLD
ncbi:MAG: ABC transporter permease [Myxococcaceae bacterium]|nr:MAG: ABC transporter permease [Myxococcaceae bacterium]